MFYKVIFLCLLIEFSYGKTLPSFITRCKYTEDSDEMGDCVKKVFLDNKEKFMEGIPEMHIPPLDPFTIPRIDFKTGDGDVIGLNAVFTKVKVEGARNGIIDKVVTDIPNGKAILEVTIPYLSIVGEYQLDGRILVMQLNGTGEGIGNFSDLHAVNRYDGKLVTRNNKEYIEWSNPTLDLSVGGIYVHFEDLFKGNKELTETTNLAINENSKEILKELKPLVEETISAILFNLVQQVFHTFSVEELFEK